MFKVYPHTFNRDLLLKTPILWDYITADMVKFFDKDGFELTPLEHAYYRENEIPLTYCLYNLACHKPWIEQTDVSSGVLLDHSMILERYGFTGYALDQLKRHVEEIPTLLKLIHTKPKWGIDFSVDYAKDGQILDLFHIEVDSYSYDEIVATWERATNIITSTDWEDGAKRMLHHKDQWEHLEGHAQSDWKAQFFGFHKSEHISKVF